MKNYMKHNFYFKLLHILLVLLLLVIAVSTYNNDEHYYIKDIHWLSIFIWPIAFLINTLAGKKSWSYILELLSILFIIVAFYYFR